MLDGVCRRGTDGEPDFVEVSAPTDQALQTVLHKIITRTMKLLTRRGGLIEEQGQTYMADNDADSDDARALGPLQAAAWSYRIAFGPRAGQKVLTVQGTMSREPQFHQNLCADMQGFSLHAAVCSRRTTAKRWSNCVAASPARRWPTKGCSATSRVRWC